MDKSINKYIEESIKKNWQGKALSDLQGATLSYEELAVKMAKLQITFIFLKWSIQSRTLSRRY